MPRTATVTLLCSAALACVAWSASRLLCPLSTSVGEEVTKQVAAKVGSPATSWSVRWTEGERLDWLLDAARRSGATSAREELDCSHLPYWEFALANEPLSARATQGLAFIRHEHGRAYTAVAESRHLVESRTGAVSRLRLQPQATPCPVEPSVPTSIAGLSAVVSALSGSPPSSSPLRLSLPRRPPLVLTPEFAPDGRVREFRVALEANSPEQAVLSFEEAAHALGEAGLRPARTTRWSDVLGEPPEHDIRYWRYDVSHGGGRPVHVLLAMVAYRGPAPVRRTSQAWMLFYL